jgi:hypothetical protein
VLNKSKTRYTQIQKLIYAILITTRKLKHYFDGFHMVIKTEFSLGTIIRNKDANGRIAKWAMELCPFAWSLHAVILLNPKHWLIS